MGRAEGKLCGLVGKWQRSVVAAGLGSCGILLVLQVCILGVACEAGFWLEQGWTEGMLWSPTVHPLG